MKKRIFSLFLAVLMVICMIPAISLVSYAGDTVTVDALPEDANREHFGELISAYGDIWARYGDKVAAKLAKYSALNDESIQVSEEEIATLRTAYETARDAFYALKDDIRKKPTTEPSASDYEDTTAYETALANYNIYVTHMEKYNEYLAAEKAYKAAESAGRRGEKKIADFYENFTDVAVADDAAKFRTYLDYYCTAGKGNYGYYEDLWYDDGHLVAFLDMANLSYDKYSVTSNLAGTTPSHFAKFVDASESAIVFPSEEAKTAFYTAKEAYEKAYVDYMLITNQNWVVDSSVDSTKAEEIKAAYDAAKEAFEAEVAKYPEYNAAYFNGARVWNTDISTSSRKSYIKVVGGSDIGSYLLLGTTCIYDNSVGGFSVVSQASANNYIMLTEDGFVKAVQDYHYDNNPNYLSVGILPNRIFNYSALTDVKVFGIAGGGANYGVGDTIWGTDNIWEMSGITSEAGSDGYYGGFTYDVSYRDSGYYDSYYYTQYANIRGTTGGILASSIAAHAFGNLSTSSTSNVYTNFGGIIGATAALHEILPDGGYGNPRIGIFGLGMVGASNKHNPIYIKNWSHGASVYAPNFRYGLYTTDASFNLLFKGQFMLDEDGTLNGGKYYASTSINGFWAEEYDDVNASRYAYLGDGVHAATFNNADGTETTAASTIVQRKFVAQGVLDLKDKNVYAARFYNVALTDEQVARNHFADLMYYGGYEITDAVKNKINSENSGEFYQLFNEYRVGQDYGGAFEKFLDYALFYRDLYDNTENLYAEFDLTLINEKTTGYTHVASDSGRVYFKPDNNYTSPFSDDYTARYSYKNYGYMPQLRATDGIRRGTYFSMTNHSAEFAKYGNAYFASSAGETNPAFINAPEGTADATALNLDCSVTIDKVMYGDNNVLRRQGDQPTRIYLGDRNVYYVRVYGTFDEDAVIPGKSQSGQCELATELNESDNNKFADVVRYYGIDVSKYVKLTNKSDIIAEFADTELGLEGNAKSVVVYRISKAIDDEYLAETLGTTAAVLDSILTFEGYQARTTLNVGLRSVYSINTTKLAAEGYNVVAYGAIIGAYTDGYTHGDYTVSFDGTTVTSASQVIYQVVGSSSNMKVFDSDEVAHNIEISNNKDRNADDYLMFAYTVDYIKFVNEGDHINSKGEYCNADGSLMTDEQKAAVTVRSDLYEKYNMFRGFIILEKDGVNYTYYIDAYSANYTSANGAVSMKDVAAYYEDNYGTVAPIKMVNDFFTAGR